MNLILATRQKLQAALALTQALQASDFPHLDSKAALLEIQRIFETHMEDVEGLDAESDPGTVNAYCHTVHGSLRDYLPFLGHIQHSKNATNAFELYQPLLRLARRVIDDDGIRLILASEWELSPFTLIGAPALPSFVWVGLPASESSNALLVPLAGHELGHSIWFREDYGVRYQPDLESRIVDAIQSDFAKYQELVDEGADPATLLEDMFALLSWSPALKWALRQAEEVFCDLVGLRLFGESYLHAFSYLLAPGGSERASPHYPTLRARAGYLADAAPDFGVSIPTGYVSLFQEVDEPDDARGFLSGIAEKATAGIVKDLITDINLIASNRGIPVSDEEHVNAVLDAIARLTPFDGETTLGEILTAGWRASFDRDPWSDRPQLKERRHIVLNELLLKSAQVLEYNTRLQE